MGSFFLRLGVWFSRLVAGNSAATNAAIAIAAGEGTAITASNLWSWISGNSEEDSQGGVVNGAIDIGNSLTDALRKNFHWVGILLTVILILAFQKQLKSLFR